MHARLEPLLLALAIVAAGLASLAAGQDANWDLLNYHLYNPWAWLTGRYGFDLAPAQLQTYHNPLLDVPFHLMVAHGWPPRAIAFVLAIPAGVTAYVLYRIATLHFGGLAQPWAATAVVAAVAIGVTGPNARSMLGTTMNEWPGTALLAIALFLLLRGLVHGAPGWRALAAAGLLAGAASGLKLTAATYAVGLAVALLAVRGPRRGIGATFVFGAATLAGIAITLGPWMAKMHALTGNPLFPYYNALFTSPWLPADWQFFKAFGPRSFAQWLTLPFDLLRPPQYYVSEQRYRDARVPVLAALALVALLAPLGFRLAGRRRPASGIAVGPGVRAAYAYLAVYVAVSFALWAWLHAIHRYLLALEVLTGIALVALVLHLTTPRWKTAALVALALAVIATTRVPSWWRVPFGEDFVRVEAPPVAPGTLVLVVGGPMAYVLPSLSPDARYVGIANNLVPLGADYPLHRTIRSQIDAHRGPLASLSIAREDPGAALASYGLRRTGPCATVRSNLSRQALELCAVERTAAPQASGGPAAAR